jgi:hypothetical protein
MIETRVIRQESYLLGRQKAHDSRSRAFAMPAAVDRSGWRDRSIRVFDPVPNPSQEVGCCTGVAKCVQLNAAGNRRAGRVLRMRDATALYSEATEIDEFGGSWPPDDTGSSGLASCKAAIALGLAGEYRWIFGGADEVVQNVMAGRVISVGTYWYWDMFYPANTGGVARVSGGIAGGHQWAVRGYDVDRDLVLGRCWWGAFRDFWMRRADLDALLRDDGDAHFQVTA